MNNNLETLIKICESNLQSSNKCLNYLSEERGFSKDIVKKFRIGYFPQNVAKLLEFVPSDALKDLTIIDYKKTSLFADYFYLIFPIFSERDEAVGIGGRTLLTEVEREYLNLPKYKNSSFKKANYLYGLNLSKHSIVKKQNAYIVEGYFDQISLNSNNIENSVAICGTAFSKNHMIKLARYTDKLSFILDQDDSGIRAMEAIYNKYSNQGIKLRFLSLPKGCKDIDDYFKNGGNNKSFEKDLKHFIPGWI